MNQISFKRGDTLTLSCVYKVNGVAASLADLDIKSQIRNLSRTLIYEFDVIKETQTGAFTLTAPADDTKLFPLSLLFCDVQFTQGDNVRSTQTFNVVVIEDITK
jgi:hypothetical protein